MSNRIEIKIKFHCILCGSSSSSSAFLYICQLPTSYLSLALFSPHPHNNLWLAYTHTPRHMYTTPTRTYFALSGLQQLLRCYVFVSNSFTALPFASLFLSLCSHTLATRNAVNCLQLHTHTRTHTPTPTCTDAKLSVNMRLLSSYC